MSGPGFVPSDLCSIRAAAEREELSAAVRSGFSADGYPLGDDDPPAPLTSDIDRAIRLSTAVAVLAVAGIAAYVSYWHAYAVVRAHGETGITARLEPATIDGLVYGSSMVVLYAARHRVPVPSLARWCCRPRCLHMVRQRLMPAFRHAVDHGARVVTARCCWGCLC